ncbi:MAG: hypothetical protein JXR03_11150 [Cyclobacteriaceae bacterium]
MLFSFAPEISEAQIDFLKSIRARSISIEFASLNGSFRDEGFQQLQKDARFGYLFDDPGSYVWNGGISENSFNLIMNFKMKDPEKFRHELLLGIKRINRKVDWLTSTATPPSQFKGRAELTKAVIGYRYYLIKSNFFKLSAGAQMDAGFTISSFTKEKSNLDINEYFGHKSSQFGLELPVLIEIQPFKGMIIYIGPGFGVGFYGHDGFTQGVFTQSLITGLRFNI